MKRRKHLVNTTRLAVFFTINVSTFINYIEVHEQNELLSDYY